MSQIGISLAINSGGKPPWALTQLFLGTGRVALFALGANNTTFGSFGDCATIAKTARRADKPWYCLGKELVTGKSILVYDIPSNAEGNAGVPFLSCYGIYKPMKKIRYDDATVKNQSAAAIGLPYTDVNTTSADVAAGTKNFTVTVGTTEPNATRLGCIVGFAGSNCGVQVVSIVDGGSNAIVPNLLPTATQMVARGQISSTALVSNGGIIPDAARCMGTNANDNTRGGQTRYNHVPLADNLTAGAFTIKFIPTNVPGIGGGTVDRAYPLYFTYGTAAMLFNDAGTEPYLCGYWSGWTDGSTSETYTLGGLVTGSGNPSVICGNGHGNDKLSANVALTVDGAAVELYGKSASRARASNVATIVFDRAHKRTTGDLVTISGMSGTGYNAEGVSVTVTNSTTFTYANTGSDEGVTTDTGGRFIAHAVIFGSTASLVRASNIFHPNYNSGTVAVATAAVTYTIDPSCLTTQASVTLSVNYDCDTSTYVALMSAWCGARATVGPEYMGTTAWRALSLPGPGQVLSANDDSEVIVGDYPGYAVYGQDTSNCTVIDYSALSVEPGLNSGAAKIFVQDRVGGLTDKTYVRLNTTLTAHLAGYTYSSTVKRFDAPNISAGAFSALTARL